MYIYLYISILLLSVLCHIIFIVSHNNDNNMIFFFILVVNISQYILYYGLFFEMCNDRMKNENLMMSFFFFVRTGVSLTERSSSVCPPTHKTDTFG